MFNFKRLEQHLEANGNRVRDKIVWFRVDSDIYEVIELIASDFGITHQGKLAVSPTARLILENALLDYLLWRQKQQEQNSEDNYA